MVELILREEEREVLLSIYEGDPAFKALNRRTYQYKYGEEDDQRSFLLEISWAEEYPAEKPKVSMDAFYNKHISQKVKDKIIAHVDAEAEQWLGCAMTYTLIESVKEHFSELIADQPDSIVEDEPDSVVCLSSQATKLTIDESNQQQDTTKKPKKEVLTKAQKRRQWNRTDGKGEKPRGWDWVDIIKHLSQTGSKPE